MAINRGIAILYKSGFWLPRVKGDQVGRMVWAFLAHYAKCASICMRVPRRRFAMTPKHHMIAHDAYGMCQQAGISTWVENPLSRTNQMQEDFIGRPARISRRVCSRSIHTSLMLRALVNYKLSILSADNDDRGLDNFSHP